VGTRSIIPCTARGLPAGAPLSMWKILSQFFAALTGGGRAPGGSTPTVIRSNPDSSNANASNLARPAPSEPVTVQPSISPSAKPSLNAGQATSTTTGTPAAALPAKPRVNEHHPRADSYLEEREKELLARISDRIAKGDLELPQLPSTSMAVIDMTSKATADISDIVKAIESDPVLSSEIIKTSNSALYSGAEPVETIAAAVVRIGLRNLRTLMFSLSMRSTVLRDKRLSSYAEEVWRHAFSTATIARAIAKPVGVEPDRAFLLGLLADIGKVSLLAMLRKEVPKGADVSPALVGRVFYLYHEIAGGRLAEAWHMPQDIVAVAGCHHRFQENQHNQKDAALVSLALRLDMVLGRDDCDAGDMLLLPEMEFLALPTSTRQLVVEAAQEARESALKTAAA